MNWSGGYKNRFRSRTNSHPATRASFQQQKRIALVENGVNETEQSHPAEATSLEPVKNNGPPLLYPPIEDEHFLTTDQDEPPAEVQKPFSNIPDGSPSSYSDVVSDTCYSPPSSGFSRDSVGSCKENGSGCPSPSPPLQQQDSPHSESSGGYSPSPSQLANIGFSSPGFMSFLTPVSKKPSTSPSATPNASSKVDPTQLLEISMQDDDGLKYFDSPHIATVDDTKLETGEAAHAPEKEAPVHRTPLNANESIFHTPIQERHAVVESVPDKDLFVTPIQQRIESIKTMNEPTVALVQQRKQVRFASPPEESDRTSKRFQSTPMPPKRSSEDVLNSGSTVFQDPDPVQSITGTNEQECDSRAHRKLLNQPSGQVSTTQPGTPIEQPFSPVFDFENPKSPDNPAPQHLVSQESAVGPTETFSSATSRRPSRSIQKMFRPRKKNRHNPCHCRTVVRLVKIKIRDAATQTSP